MEVNRSRPAHAYRPFSVLFDSTCAVLFVQTERKCVGAGFLVPAP